MNENGKKYCICLLDVIQLQEKRNIDRSLCHCSEHNCKVYK